MSCNSILNITLGFVKKYYEFVLHENVWVNLNSKLYLIKNLSQASKTRAVTLLKWPAYSAHIFPVTMSQALITVSSAAAKTLVNPSRSSICNTLQANLLHQSNSKPSQLHCYKIMMRLKLNMLCFSPILYNSLNVNGF